ncbi:MAG: GAF domain-containing protein [Bacteroidetes bacterium]|nr:MAG: GAF domain-containing protein [Bacteroidota bacterium]TAG94598.1 MAG: GAF domain-containing protein [Bacteroidota bacterium]
MNFIKKYWLKIIELGIDKTMFLSLSQRIKFSNQLSILMLVVSLIFIGIYISRGYWRGVYLTTSLPCVALIILSFNYFKQHKISRLLLSVALCLNTLTMTILIKSTRPELVTIVNFATPRFIIISSLVISLLLFTSKEALWAWLPAFLVAFLGNWGFDMVHQSFEVTAQKMNVFVKNYKNIGDDSLIATIILMSVMGIFRHLTYQYEMYNENILQDSKKSNDSLLKREEELKETILAVEQSNEFEKIRNWEGEGLAALHKKIRTNFENDELYDSLLSFIVEYTRSQQGAIFMVDEINESEKELYLVSVYAWDKERFDRDRKIKWGEGLLGQCAKNTRPKYVRRIPENYTFIPAGLHTLAPREMLLLPLLFHKKLYGVLEINSIEEIATYKIEFLERCAEIVASTMASLQNIINSNKILKEVQLLSDELSNQSTEFNDIITYYENKIAELEQKNKEI